jgi:hypothetical protein
MATRQEKLKLLESLNREIAALQAKLDAKAAGKAKKAEINRKADAYASNNSLGQNLKESFGDWWEGAKEGIKTSIPGQVAAGMGALIEEKGLRSEALAAVSPVGLAALAFGSPEFKEGAKQNAADAEAAVEPGTMRGASYGAGRFVGQMAGDLPAGMGGGGIAKGVLSVLPSITKPLAKRLVAEGVTLADDVVQGMIMDGMKRGEISTDPVDWSSEALLSFVLGKIGKKISSSVKPKAGVPGPIDPEAPVVGKNDPSFDERFGVTEIPQPEKKKPGAQKISTNEKTIAQLNARIEADEAVMEKLKGEFEKASGEAKNKMGRRMNALRGQITKKKNQVKALEGGIETLEQQEAARVEQETSVEAARRLKAENPLEAPAVAPPAAAAPAPAALEAAAAPAPAEAPLANNPSGETPNPATLDVGKRHEILYPIIEVLPQLGPVGKELADKIDYVGKTADQRMGNAMVTIQKFKDMGERLGEDAQRLVVDVIEGYKASSDPEINGMAEEIRRLLSEVGDEARKAKLQVSRSVTLPDGSTKEITVDFKELKNYFPHLYSAKYDEALTSAFKSGGKKASSTSFSRDPNVNRDGALDPVHTLTNYFSDVYRSIEEAKAFGFDNTRENFEAIRRDWLSRAKNSGLDSKAISYIEPAFNALFGRKYDATNQTGKWFTKAMKWEAANKLVTAAIPNLTQIRNVAAVVGWPKAMKSATFALKNKENFREALKKIDADPELIWESGALSSSLLEDFVRNGDDSIIGDVSRRLGTIADKVGMKETGAAFKNQGITAGVMTGTGFKATERFNRTLAAVAGIQHAQRLLDITQTGGSASSLRKLFGSKAPNQADPRAAQLAKEGLLRLGVSPESIEAGKLSRDDLKNAAYEMAKHTQFGGRPEHAPIFFQSSALHRVMGQFLSFSLKQYHFDKAIAAGKNEMAGGKGGSILGQLVGMQVLGYASDQLRDLIFHRTEEVGLNSKGVLGNESIPARALRQIGENFMEVGPLGLVGSTISEAAAGYDAIPRGSVMDTLNNILSLPGKVGENVLTGEFGKAAGEVNKFMGQESQWWKLGQSAGAWAGDAISVLDGL